MGSIPMISQPNGSLYWAHSNDSLDWAHAADGRPSGSSLQAIEEKGLDKVQNQKFKTRSSKPEAQNQKF
jgi:hypothetical protein